MSTLQDVARALPDYEIGHEMGRGQCGIVWSGRHRQLRREVAIKQLAGAERLTFTELFSPATTAFASGSARFR
jgi:hypothetical protein